MPIEILCPECGTRLAVPDAAAGRTAKCPKCGDLMTVPAIVEGKPAAPAPTPAADPPRKRVRADEDEDRPRAKRRRDDDDDEDDDRPRKNRKVGRGAPPVGLIFGLLAGLMLLTAFGIGLYFVVAKKSDSAGGKAGRALLPAGWVSWKNPDGFYRVNLPAEPQPTQGKQGQNWYLSMVLPTDAQPLVVMIQVSPVKGLPAQLHEFARNPPQASAFGPTQRKDITWLGKPATELTSQTDSREKLTAGDFTSGRVRPSAGNGPLTRYVVLTRVAEKDETYYAVTLLSVNGRPTETEEKAVFDSFEILK